MFPDWQFTQFIPPFSVHSPGPSYAQCWPSAQSRELDFAIVSWAAGMPAGRPEWKTDSLKMPIARRR